MTYPIPSPILVTGAGGLIGSHICREAVHHGAQVIALLRDGESAVNLKSLPNLEIVRGDIRDRDGMCALVQRSSAVVHAAALNTLWHRPSRDFHSINVRGTEILCDAALKARTPRFISFSSCEVMGRARAQSTPNEQHRLDSRHVRGHYERSKLAAELTVQRACARGLPTTILRPTAVMGPQDIHGTPPGRLVRAFLARDIPAYFDAGINIIDARDVAMATINALVRFRPDATFILGGHNTELGELLTMLEEHSGIPAPTRTVGYRTALAAAALFEGRSLITRKHPGLTVNGIRTIRHPWHFDSTKARRDLGLEPRPLSETVRDTVEWHQKTEGRRTTDPFGISDEGR